jgi:S-adenosylmethionine-diacylglycerol 3-amino-3-carboxypropyl transferase
MAGLIRSVVGFVLSLFSSVFNWIVARCYTSQIVFNCAWEDPRLDREALKLTEEDNVVIITTAGCNVLSLAIEGPNHVFSIDRNHCQNALLELKIAAIREYDYDTFWTLFGTGRLPNFSKVHYPRLRQHLSTAGRAFWDTHAHYFNGTGLRPSYYWRGCSGILAWVMLGYFRLIGVYRPLLELMQAKTLAEQKQIYRTKIEKRMWNPVIMWFLERSFTLALLNGVPEAQRELLEKEGGFTSIGLFIKDSMETIMTKLPIHDNYFYRVYLTGKYTKDCCPDYLTEEGFKTLKNGAVNKISIHTTTITDFLREHKKKDISRFVLLDHMDWMASAPKILSEEWSEMIAHSTENARFLWRSASKEATFVGDTPVTLPKGHETVTVKDVLKYDCQTANRLHELDRVHTYASFFIADLSL